MINNLGIIFLAGGTGSRFGTKNKLMEIYKNYPLFIHSIKNLSHLCKPENVIIVCSENELENYRFIVSEYLPGKEFIYTTGGKERFNSVYNGLKKLKDKTKFVAIHDTARPLAGEYILNKCYESCLLNGSGVAAKIISDTIKRTNSEKEIIETVDRTNLWAIETPQMFITDEIFEAYCKIIKEGIFITDDAGAMEYSGKKVYLVDNPYPNKKITYKTDFNDLN